MRIALIGYGKMGRMIEKIILTENIHQIVEVISSGNASSIHSLDKNKIDVAIEFSNPKSVKENIKVCIEKKIPIVVGTTGWYDSLDELKKLTEENETALVWASNFSIGVNLLFQINQYVATLLSHFPEYKLKLKEIHHTEKKDSPSGTAISLRNDLSEIYNLTTDKIEIESERKDKVVGYHEISYTSKVDELVLSHNAFNREGFAIGAIKAATWIQHRKGFYNFSDIFNELR